MAKGKKYTQEFKDSAIQLALNSEEPVRQIARDLEISEKTLYGWLRDYKIKHNLEEAERGKKVDIPKKPSVKLWCYIKSNSRYNTDKVTFGLEGEIGTMKIIGESSHSRNSIGAYATLHF